ncbi:hypothetical protein AMTRI_Chr13g88340 [Amborella trichopoda]
MFLCNILWSKLLVHKFRPEVLILQEIKSSAPYLSVVRDIWGHRTVSFEGVDALGVSGGLWILWDPLLFHCFDVGKRHRILGIFFKGPGGGFKWGIVNVYGPVVHSFKEGFLSDLGDMLLSYDVPICFSCDFNFIRWLDEMSSNPLINSLMRMFNSFIERFQLFDLPVTGTKFTWSNCCAHNLIISKLDHFLVTQDWMEAFLLVTVKALPRLSSDHTPRLLNTTFSISGKNPFHLELCWLDEPGIVDLIKST